MQVKVCFEEQKERFGFLSSYPKDPFLGGRGRQGQGGISICFHTGISVWVAFSMNSRAHWTLYSKVLQQQAASVAQVSEHSCTSPYSSYSAGGVNTDTLLHAPWYSVVRERGGVLATVAGPAAGRGFLPHLPAARPVPNIVVREHRCCCARGRGSYATERDVDTYKRLTRKAARYRFSLQQ